MYEVVTVRRGVFGSVAIRDWDSDDCQMELAVFDSEERAWEWAEENYPAYFMDPRECANDWRAYRFEVRAI